MFSKNDTGIDISLIETAKPAVRYSHEIAGIQKLIVKGVDAMVVLQEKDQADLTMTARQQVSTECQRVNETTLKIIAEGDGMRPGSLVIGVPKTFKKLITLQLEGRSCTKSKCLIQGFNRSLAIDIKGTHLEWERSGTQQ